MSLRPFDARRAVAALLAPWLFAGLLGAHAGEREPVSREFAERWRWVHFTTWSGLPSDDVLQVLEDAEGVPWAATAAGLAWYDGHRWQAVTREDGLPETAPASVAPRPGGGLAVVVEGGAYVGGPQGFRRVLTPSGQARSVACLEDGSLLVTIDGLLFQVRPGGEAARRLLEDRRRGWVQALWSREAGRALVATWSGLMLTDGHSWTNVVDLAEPGTDTAEISQAFEIEPGRGLLTVTQPYHLAGAWWWDDHGRLERATLDGPESVVAAAVLDDETLVAAYESGDLGLRDLRRAGWQRTSIPPSIGGISCLSVRANGDLWAGTARGLWLFRASSERWKQLGPAADGDLGVVHDVLLAADGATWIATRGGLVVQRPGREDEVLRQIDGRPIPVVTTVAQDGEGAIWIGSGSGFEGAWRRKDGRWRHFADDAGLHAPRVHAVRIDRQGRPWLLGLSRHAATGGPGAFVFEDGRFRHVSLPGGVDAQRVYDLVQSRDGALWFATNDGLHRLRDGAWKSWSKAEGLPADRVFALELDPRDGLWLSTGRDGVCLLEDEALRLCEGTAEGLPNAAVWDMAFDASGALWASTRGGLGVRREGAWSRVLPRDGLPLLRLWPLEVAGERLLVGSNGRGLAELRLAEAEHPPPRVFIVEEDSSGHLTRFEWRASAWWGEQGEREVESRWRLDDGPWSEWDRHEQVLFEDLSAGTHVLEVEAKGLLGQRAGRPASQRFEVPTALWMRTEVLVPVVLLFIALAGWIGFGLRRRRQFARELARREARFREILDNASDVIFTAGLDGRLTTLNRAGRRLAGIGDADPVGLDWYAMLGPESRERAAEALRHKVAGEATSTYEIELDLPGMEPRILEVHSRLVRDRGRASEIQGVARDVTGRRRLERQLRHAQKLESLGLLAGGVAHDFNNLLLAILGNLDLARTAYRDGRSPASALDDLEAAAERATDLARVMLAYSGKARFEIRPLDLSELSEEILRLLRASLPKSVEFEVELDESLPAVEGDRAQLQQVVLNLVTNAADALGESGGRIFVRTGSGSAPEARRGDPVLDGDLGERVTWLEVRDEGPGIDDAARARIFDPFFSTKGPGRGLGLSAVLGIVRVHGGALLLDCPPSGGTSFRVLLNALNVPAPRAANERPAAPPVSDELQGARILVVDDEQRVREVACRLLERLGCTTIEAVDGLDAQRRVEESGGTLDAVLLDLVMPRCGGPEAMVGIRELQPDLPIVLTSGYSEDEGPARAVGEGAAGFLMKPYRLAQLEEAMRTAIRTRQRSGQ